MTVTNGSLTINARTQDKAINMTYILITCISVDALPTESATPTASTSPSPTPSIPVISTTPTPVESSTAPVDNEITYQYNVVSNWGGSYQAEIVITNHSNKTLNGWTLTCNYNSAITNLWGAELVGQTGKKVTIKNPSWITTLAPGSSLTISFIASGTDTSSPTSYSIS